MRSSAEAEGMLFGTGVTFVWGGGRRSRALTQSFFSPCGRCGSAAGVAGCGAAGAPLAGERCFAGVSQGESGDSFSLAIAPLQQDGNFPDVGLEAIVIAGEAHGAARVSWWFPRAGTSAEVCRRGPEGCCWGSIWEIPQTPTAPPASVGQCWFTPGTLPPPRLDAVGLEKPLAWLSRGRGSPWWDRSRLPLRAHRRVFAQPVTGVALVACRAPCARAGTVQMCKTQQNCHFLARETCGLSKQ